MSISYHSTLDVDPALSSAQLFKEQLCEGLFACLGSSGSFFNPAVSCCSVVIQLTEEAEKAGLDSRIH